LIRRRAHCLADLRIDFEVVRITCFVGNDAVNVAAAQRHPARHVLPVDRNRVLYSYRGAARERDRTAVGKRQRRSGARLGRNNIVKLDGRPWLCGEGRAAALDLRGAGDLADGADGIIRARRRACLE